MASPFDTVTSTVADAVRARVKGAVRAAVWTAGDRAMRAALFSSQQDAASVPKPRCT